MQTLITKYQGPTNTRGSRIGVKGWKGNKSFGYDCALDSSQNHEEAAKDYIEWLNRERDSNSWGKWVIFAMGEMPDSSGYAVLIHLAPM